MAKRLLLVDLSNNNTVDTLADARSAGVVGCWLKVTEGSTFVDAEYQRLRRLVLQAGLRVGGYHFARPFSSPAQQQAHDFAYRLGKIGRRDLRPVLDLEVGHPETGTHGVGSWARDFLHAFRAETGVCCIVYSYSSFLAGLQLPQPLGCGLWLAGYGRNDGVEHPLTVPAPWRRAVAHQFTSRGTLGGVRGHVDVSSAPRLRPLLAHGLRGL